MNVLLAGAWFMHLTIHDCCTHRPSLPPKVSVVLPTGYATKRKCKKGERATVKDRLHEFTYYIAQAECQESATYEDALREQEEFVATRWGDKRPPGECSVKKDVGLMCEDVKPSVVREAANAFSNWTIEITNEAEEDTCLVGFWMKHPDGALASSNISVLAGECYLKLETRDVGQRKLVFRVIQVYPDDT
jgi:hypothetical protein